MWSCYWSWTDRQTEITETPVAIFCTHTGSNGKLPKLSAVKFFIWPTPKRLRLPLYVGPYSAIISHTRHIPVTKAHSVSSRFVHCSETYEKTVTDSPTKRRVNVPVRCLLLHLWSRLFTVWPAHIYVIVVIIIVIKCIQRQYSVQDRNLRRIIPHSPTYKIT